MSLRRRYERALERARELGAERSIVELVERAVATLDDSERDFTETHWDRSPDALVVEGVPIIAPGMALTELGALECIEYSTVKARTDAVWVHEFEKSLPRLCFTPAARPRDRRLVVVGGSYTISERGIVG